MTDEILDNPKDRDVKQKSQDEEVNACKFPFNSHIVQLLTFNFCSDSKLRKSHGTHDSCQCHEYFNRIRRHG